MKPATYPKPAATPTGDWSYTTDEGATYTSSDGKTFLAHDGTSYLSLDGKTVSRDGQTYTLRRTQNAPVDFKTVADLICRLNSGGTSTGHLEAWAAAYATPAKAAFASETKAAEKAANDARKATLRAQLADLEA